VRGRRREEGGERDGRTASSLLLPLTSIDVDALVQKKSAAAVLGASGAGWRGERLDRRAQLVEGVAVECVVDPAAVAAVGHEAGVLEGLEVMREQGLTEVEGGRELADAALAGGQQLDDTQSVLV
jgi:hypothetical protein